MNTRRRPPLGILALAVALIQVVGTGFASRRFHAELGVGPVLLLLAGPALLLLRRRAPGPMAAGVAAVSVAYLGLGFPLGPFPLSFAVALVLAVLAGARWWAWGSAAAAGAAALLLALPHLPPARMLPLFAWLAVLLLVAELGRNARVRREEHRRAARERAVHQRNEERLVLARDIHDVVAHSLSMINVQASVALHLARREADPQTMRQALENIKSGSKQSLDEVREVLAVLRQDAPRVPSQRLEQLGELIERVASANLTVDFTPPGLPPPPWVDERVENALYRVVQESLTNVVRHARATRVTVVTTWDDAQASVQISDDGIGRGAADEGNGITGMRERLQALGGTLRITPANPAGPARQGTRVAASIPAPAPGAPQ